MKKYLSLLFAGLMVFVTGCDKDPEEVANRIGKATGVAADIYLTGDVRTVVIEITSKINESATSFATGDVSDSVKVIVDPIVDKYVADGKINAEQAKIIKSAGDVLGLGLEYMFEKHPKWKSNTDVVVKAVAAFTDGFLSVVNDLSRSLKSKIDYDEDAYKFIISHKK